MQHLYIPAQHFGEFFGKSYLNKSQGFYALNRIRIALRRLLNNIKAVVFREKPAFFLHSMQHRVQNISVRGTISSKICAGEPAEENIEGGHGWTHLR